MYLDGAQCIASAYNCIRVYQDRVLDTFAKLYRRHFITLSTIIIYRYEIFSTLYVSSVGSVVVVMPANESHTNAYDSLPYTIVYVRQADGEEMTEK